MLHVYILMIKHIFIQMPGPRWEIEQKLWVKVLPLFLLIYGASIYSCSDKTNIILDLGS